MDKALIFDIGGVIIFLDNAIMLRNLSTLMNYPPPAANLLTEIRASGIGVGDLSAQGLYEQLKHSYGIDAPFSEFLEAWCSHFSPNEALIRALKSLSNSWDISICSNTNDGHWNFLNNRYGLRQLAGQVLLSFECGIEKPHKKMFDLVREKCVEGRSCAVFVDDDEVNVNAAIQAGFIGILFRDERDLITKLEAIS